MEWSLGSGKVEQAARLAWSLYWYWIIRGNSTEPGEWYQAVLERSADLPPRLRIKMLVGAGYMASLQRDQSRAERILEESLRLSREVEDKTALFHSLHSLYTAAFFGGDLGRAAALKPEFSALARELGAPWLRWTTLIIQAVVALSRDEILESKTLIEEALELGRLIGNPFAKAAALLSLGTLLQAEGDYRHSAPLLREATRLHQDIGAKWGIAGGVANLANVAAAGRQPVRAARRYGAAETLLSMINLMSPVMRDTYEQNRAATWTTLGEAQFQAAWSEGWTVPLDQVLEYTLAERSDLEPPDQGGVGIQANKV